jgi:S1-C subfamily serine protease
MTRIVCPSCGAVYQLAAEFMGKKLVCHRCQARLLWTEQGVEVVEVAVPTLPHGERTELVAELQFEDAQAADETDPADEAAAAPTDEAESPPLPPRPRPIRSRQKPKSLVMPILIISLTALVTLGVVICAVVLLVMGLSGSDKNQLGRGFPLPPVPTEAPPGPWPGPGEMPGGPPVDAGEKADFTVATVEKIGLVSYQPAGPMNEGVVDAQLRTASQPTPEFVRRVKQGSVFIRVNRREGAGTGSGFFCLEPGLIITNAHVVGMLRPSDPPPTKIEVTLNSGEANAKELTARVVAVDRVNDLAALRVEPGGAALPAPFSLFPSSQLIETQAVFVAGFPRVSELGTSLSVGTGSVAALRKDAGQMRKVQVNGNMQPGNSGGPVFDTQGRVVGVSAAILGQTGINFAVPTEFINDLIYGGVDRLLVFPPVKVEGAARLPVLVRISDALLRVNEVEVESWVGRVRPALKSLPHWKATASYNVPNSQPSATAANSPLVAWSHCPP